MGKRTTSPMVVNVNIQVNIDSPNSVQDNSTNKKTIVENKKKTSFVTRLVGMFRALAELFGSIEPNIIIMLVAMIFGIRL